MPSSANKDANSRKRMFNAISKPSETNPHKLQLLAIDCEFVGVGPQKLSALGRCSIVDYWGRTILDIHAIPDDPITDYRTPWSGIRPCHMKHAIPFESARNVVKEVIKNKILVGHAVHNDFKVLKLEHSIPKELVRDTSSCKALKKMAELNGTSLSLKALSRVLLGRKIQLREHDSVEDARATMDLYKIVETEWEAELAAKRRGNPCKRARTASTSASYLDDKFWTAAETGGNDGDDEE